MSQYHNLDDSGDPGRVGVQGASSHLVLAMVQLAEHTPLPEMQGAREELYLPTHYEFKYYKSTPIQRRAFFRAVESVLFRVRALALDKAALPISLAHLEGDPLTVELIVRMTLRASPLDIANDVLIIDGGTPSLCRAVRVRLSEECRKTKRVRPFGKIVGGRSRSEDGLQLADMVAGAIRQYVTGGDAEGYHSFETKVVDLWEISSRDK